MMMMTPCWSISSARSPMYIMNNRGPSTDPCGTEQKWQLCVMYCRRTRREITVYWARALIYTVAKCFIWQVGLWPEPFQYVVTQTKLALKSVYQQSIWSTVSKAAVKSTIDRELQIVKYCRPSSPNFAPKSYPSPCWQGWVTLSASVLLSLGLGLMGWVLGLGLIALGSVMLRWSHV